MLSLLDSESNPSLGSESSSGSNRESRSRFPLNDRNLGKKIRKFKTTLGEGSFGKIYRAADENDTEFAIKEIKIDKEGIPCLLEAAIMSTIRHPAINHSIKTLIQPGVLYIFQELAISDLAHFTRSDLIFHGLTEETYSSHPSYRKISKEIFITWVHSLFQAINCLHSNNIVHCDIKAANILLYSDKSIKLTDFTLSSIGRPFPEGFARTESAPSSSEHELRSCERTDLSASSALASVPSSSGRDSSASSALYIPKGKMVCTGTHRPLEVFLNEGMDSAVDIWSIAVTIYEIFYGFLLFPVQRKNPDVNQDRSVRTKMICSILHYIQGTEEVKKISEEFYKCENVKDPTEKFEYFRALRGETTYYTDINYCNNSSTDFNSSTWKKSPCRIYDFDLNDPINEKVKACILRCLKINPKERPSIKDLLNDPLFVQPKTLGEIAASGIEGGSGSSHFLSPSAIITTSAKNLNKTRVKKTVESIRSFYSNEIKIEDKHIEEILNLYSKCYDLGEIQDELKIITCGFIIFKILLDKAIFPKTLLYKIHDILETERKICYYLKFQIYICPY